MKITFQDSSIFCLKNNPYLKNQDSHIISLIMPDDGESTYPNKPLNLQKNINMHLIQTKIKKWRQTHKLKGSK